MEHPVTGAAAGAVFTGIIQSSSGMLGIVIQMATQGLITLPAGIALMMGAEIGTCADTLLATLGRSRAALRTGIFHLAFNIASVACGLMLFPAFVTVVRWMSANASVAHQIANGHVLFNTLGVVLFAWWTRPVARLLCKLIPDLPPLVGEPADEELLGDPAPRPMA
jgi:phosphate:Na+ symporter